ncbi:E3 ubiquitin-protein ligase RNF14-like [Sphaeramia orbicularis]|uniref:E3 ubiquitin-protein ligase RNF14-like n=1 Tax=Sphaeramia orbicularis TaxID=375764 RepID=UPI00117D7555|nr:E3 ubiquitin-protein ligase RNF14-like [Sphaeramia orbicularis]
MNSDSEEQEDELLALCSIYDSDEFIRNESKAAGEFRVSVELRKDFTVTLTEGETLTQYDLSFLPPLHLTFELPEDYPSTSPPSFTLTCCWLTQAQLSALGTQLIDLYQSTGGAVVLFSWVQFLKEEALGFLDIQTRLEIPSIEHSALFSNKENQTAALSEPETNLMSDSPGVQNEVSHKNKDLTINGDYQKTPCSTETAQVSGEIDQIPENKNDLEANKAGCVPSVNMDETGLEGFPSSPPSQSLGQSEEGATSLAEQPTNSAQNKTQNLSTLILTPAQALLSQLLIHDATQKEKVFYTTVFDCGVCFMCWLGSECVQIPQCGHVFCRSCLTEFCRLQITEGNVRDITCPQADCDATPTPAQVRSLVGEELFNRFDRLLLQSTLDYMSDVSYCPRRSCGSVVIVEKSGSMAMCSVCSYAFCVLCKKTYHGTEDCQKMKPPRQKTNKDDEQGFADFPQTKEGMNALWDDYSSGSKDRRRLLESRYGRCNLVVTMESRLSQEWIAVTCKNCPYCFSRIEKNGGCNRMTCSRCSRQFCWACLTKLTYENNHQHFSHDSPCTIWAWS